MSKQTFGKLRVAYNNAHRRIFNFNNNVLNFEALMRKLAFTFISRISISANVIVKCLLNNTIARDLM